jgi:hypothetical protein
MKESFSSKMVALMGMAIVIMAVIAMFRGDRLAASLLFAATYIGYCISELKFNVNVIAGEGGTINVDKTMGEPD